MSDARFDPAPILVGLKDFQRATVDHAFHRLYLDDDSVNKFLVADEVGLGKTMVARGVIAQTIEHLWDDVERIDVIYICSNRAIAQQNIRRLEVTGEKGFSFSSRMTMIAKEVAQLRGRKVNFVSFTPSTSFDLKHGLGMGDERVLLWWILRTIWGAELLDSLGARRIFQGWISSVERFDERCEYAESWAKELDRDLLGSLETELAATGLRSDFDDLVTNFGQDDEDRYEHGARATLVGELRSILARRCVQELEPDLVVLDEFQRFRHLMGADSEAGQLATDLFDYEDNRTLLLSATPYKMFTSGDDDEDHHRDFIRTVSFLLGDDAGRFQQVFDQFRTVVLEIDRLSPDQVRAARLRVEVELRRVMARTERIVAGQDRNGMLREVQKRVNGLDADDVRTFVALEELANGVGARGVVEYWKSAPFFVNFTDGYKIDRKIEEALTEPETDSSNVRELLANVGGQIDWPSWREFDELQHDNVRLRDLAEKTTGAGAWKMLWLAPSLSYYPLKGPWAEPGMASFTKRLVFSGWNAVPKSIASLLSYDAERQMMQLGEASPANTSKARKGISTPLQFARNDKGKPAGMSTYALMHPSFKLSELGDPLRHARDDGKFGTLEELLATVAGQLRPRLDELAALDEFAGGQIEGARADEAWYWAAPLLFDREADRAGWTWHKRIYPNSWTGGNGVASDEESEEDHSAFSDHLRLAHSVVRGEHSLGRMPDDLAEVLALIAVASPANVALRSMSRITPLLPDDKGAGAQWDGACRIAWGFRTLFNLPEVTRLLRGLNTEPDLPYWQIVLRYCADGCLSAVVDEYLHTLREWLGLVEIENWDGVIELADTAADAMSLKSADYVATDHLEVSGKLKRRLRSRFALRFGDARSESDSSVVRAGNVRTSFNSPFWPFVVASTSVGQEGLDFHVYCHAIVHWNLPHNPVDLEQREGRVHRYKGHAVRRNVAAKHGDAALTSEGDPWQAMFDAAVAARGPDENDLVPYWVFPGDATIDRYVPALPMSKEVSKLEELKRDVARYRMVFGQPRQDDLLKYLRSTDESLLNELRIDLSPG